MQYSQVFFLCTVATKLFDALAIVAAWHLTWLIRFDSRWIPVEKGIPDFAPYQTAILPLVLTFVVVFHTVGAYRSDRLLFGFRSLKKIAEGCALGTLVFISILYFIDAVSYSRAFLIVFAVTAMACLVVTRFLIRQAWTLVNRHFIKPFRVLLVGSGELLSMYVHTIQSRQPYPTLWVGRLGPETGGLADIPWLGAESELSNVIEQRRVDSVIVSYPPSDGDRYSKVLDALSNELVSVKVVPNFGKESTFTYQADQECGIPLLMFNKPPASVTDRFFKRLTDLVGSFLLLIIFSPIFLLIALLVKLTSRGPVFYSQLRLGADGREFMCHKFRSMQVNAEDSSGPVWASRGDSRTTPIGKFLRQSSLDELPQLFNVLVGEMSLVGPRPERPVFVKQFKTEIPQYMLRHKMKSGMTGWAQINGWRGDTSLEERIKHDLFYIGHWSHFFDLKILVLTLFRGFVNKNAH